jgi:hypothetical protein
MTPTLAEELQTPRPKQPPWVPLGWHATDFRTHGVEVDTELLAKLQRLTLVEMILAVFEYAIYEKEVTFVDTWRVALDVRCILLGELNPEPYMDRETFNRVAATLASLTTKGVLVRIRKGRWWLPLSRSDPSS